MFPQFALRRSLASYSVLRNKYGVELGREHQNFFTTNFYAKFITYGNGPKLLGYIQKY